MSEEHRIELGRRGFLGAAGSLAAASRTGGGGHPPVAGSKADTLFWSQQAYEKAREPKELHVVEGATHIDMYDRPQFVEPAVSKLAEFFGRHLADAASK